MSSGIRLNGYSAAMKPAKFCQCRRCVRTGFGPTILNSMASKELTAALAAARAAGEVIRAHYQRNPAVRLKADASPVTEADLRSEEVIRATLSERFPGFGFYGEETGRHAMDAESVWLVDPIDGTKAFMRGIPFFSTQIALMRAGRLVLGVSSAPVYGELAWAEEGGGAHLNDRPIRVSALLGWTFI